ARRISSARYSRRTRVRRADGGRTARGLLAIVGTIVGAAAGGQVDVVVGVAAERRWTERRLAVGAAAAGRELRRGGGQTFAGSARYSRRTRVRRADGGRTARGLLAIVGTIVGAAAGGQVDVVVGVAAERRWTERRLAVGAAAAGRELRRGGGQTFAGSARVRR